MNIFELQTAYDLCDIHVLHWLLLTINVALVDFLGCLKWNYVLVTYLLKQSIFEIF